MSKASASASALPLPCCCGRPHGSKHPAWPPQLSPVPDPSARCLIKAVFFSPCSGGKQTTTWGCSSCPEGQVCMANPATQFTHTGEDCKMLSKASGAARFQIYRVSHRIGEELVIYIYIYIGTTRMNWSISKSIQIVLGSCGFRGV